MFNKEQLKEGQAVKCEGQIFARLPAGEYCTESGSEFKVEWGGRLVPIEGDIFQIKRGRKIIDCYEKDGNTLSAKDYSAKLRALTSPFEDEDGDVFYPDLETEYRVRKELEDMHQWSPVYIQEEEQHTPVDIEIVGEILPTGSDFIHNPLVYGRLQFKNSNIYKVDLTGITTDEFSKWVKDNSMQAKVDNKSLGTERGYTEFAKINNKYVMTDFGRGKESGETQYTTSLKDAKDIEKSLRRSVRKHLDLQVFGENKPFNGPSVKGVWDGLNYCKRLASKVDSKQKTISEYRDLCRSIQELINYIEEE